MKFEKYQKNSRIRISKNFHFVFMKISPYTIVFLSLNILSLVWVSLYFLQVWDIEVIPFVTLFFFHEMFLSFIASGLYIFLFFFITHKNKYSLPHTFFFFLFLALTLYGSGMHNGANQINILHSSDAIYFYDEILSHAFTVFGLLTTGMTLALTQSIFQYQKKLHHYEKYIIIGSGIFQGFFLGIGTLESQFGPWGLGLSLIFSLFLIGTINGRTISQIPIFWYYIFHFGTTALFLALFGLITGGFFEPSEMGLGKF